MNFVRVLTMVLLLAPPLTVFAQLPNNLEGVAIVLSPEYPQPGQVVQATVTSPSENVRAADIVWLLDNEVRQQEAGNDSFTFTAGALGSTQTVGVLVKTPSGQVFAQTVTLRPSEVTLVWEADTYTPPLYRGRTLYTSGSTIRAEAITHFVDESGRRYDPSELIYTWSKNGTVLGKSSGIAAHTLLTDGPKFLGSYILSVKVTTPDGTRIAQSAARITTTEPMVRLYERDPLLGVRYHDAINADSPLSSASQFEVHATPYYMDARGPNDARLIYTWRVDGVKVLPPSQAPADLNLRFDTRENISTRIAVTIDHADHLLQSGEGEFEVLFEGSARNSLFGL